MAKQIHIVLYGEDYNEAVTYLKYNAEIIELDLVGAKIAKGMKGRDFLFKGIVSKSNFEKLATLQDIVIFE
jgi:hypothetical protein